MIDRVAPISSQKKLTGRVDFIKDDFDILIEQKGLNLIHELAIKCSCNRESNGGPLPNHVSCGGTGFIFVDPYQIRGVIQSVSFDSKVNQYTQLDPGTAMLTVRHSSLQRLGWMDRLTLKDGDTVFSQTIYPELKTISGNEELSALATYDILEMDYIYLFDTEDTEHIKLEQFEADGSTPKDFTIDGRKVKLSDSIKDTIKAQGKTKVNVGVRYKHYPQYLVMDIVRDVRNTKIIETKRQEKLEKEPIHCIIKKVHYLLGDKGFEV